MKRAALLVAAMLVVTGALVGSAATLGMTTHKIDAFAGAKPATAPATGSSCTTATPAPMTAPPVDLYVSTPASLHHYSFNTTTLAFTQVGASALTAANSSSAGVAATTSWVYVVNSSNQAVYRYTLDRTFASVLPGTISPGGISIRGLAVDEVNDELWVADRQGSNTRLRCYVLSSLVSGAGPINPTRVISVGGTDPQGLAIDSTHLYMVDGTTKRLFRALRTSTAATQGNVMAMADAPRGLELKSGVLFVAGNGPRIFRFPDLSLFFTGTANVSPSPSSPANLSHAQATGL